MVHKFRKTSKRRDLNAKSTGMAQLVIWLFQLKAQLHKLYLFKPFVFIKFSQSQGYKLYVNDINPMWEDGQSAG